MADPTRPLTLSDLWLPGDVLGGAILRGWTGPVWAIRGTEWIGATWAPHMSCAPVIYGGKVDSFAGVDNVRLDCDIPEVRDRAVRVLAAGDPVDDFGGRHCRCGTVHKESACPSCGLSFIQSADLLPIHAAELRGDITPGEAAGLVWCSVVRREAGLGVCLLPAPAAGAQLDPLDSMRLAAGYSLREPGGILLLPLPDGVVGRLECSNG